ncbi:MAG: sulfurtransferase TusA family protein [Planctomycetota bacterium]
MEPGPRASWTAERVVAEVERAWGTACVDCATITVGHEVVIGLLLGERERRCSSCLAARHGREPGGFLDLARASIARLDCFRAGWEAADRRLDREAAWPARLSSSRRLSKDDGAEADAPGSERGGPGAEEPAGAGVGPAGELGPERSSAVEAYDAGDLGCGELVLELRRRLNALAPGQRLRLVARDPGAPEDLPAWCGLTGHLLVRAAHPEYLLARRPDPPGCSP